VFQTSGRKDYKDIEIFFWREKNIVLTNRRELVRPSASANWWDSKDPSGNLTSINLLTVQQISPHHKLCVYIILYRIVYKTWAGRLHALLWHLKVNNLYICKVMLHMWFEVLLVFTVYVRQSNKFLKTLPLFYENCCSWRHPHLHRKIIPFGDVSCAALPVSDFLFKHSHNPQSTSDRLQVGFVFYNTTFQYVASTLEIHTFQDKHWTSSTGH